MPIGSIIGAVIASAAGAAMSYALAPKQPGAPDLAGATRGQVEAEAESLPARRAMEAAAQQGGTAVRSGYTQTTESGAQRAKLERVLAGLQQRWDQAGNRERGNPRQRAYLERQMADVREQIATLPETGGTVYLDSRGRVVPASEATVSFKGYGEADVQGQIAREMAQLQLDLSKKYGTDYIEEARKQLELADPQGTAARRLLDDQIQQQIQNEPDRPVADLLDSQVREQLAAGKGLDRVSQEMLNQAVRDSLSARGERSGADFSEPLTTGFEGQQRLDAGQQKALGWLASGATPEDVDYRREQQNLANLAAFTAGRTPQSQFQNLSAAQRGAVPMAQPQPGAQISPNATGTGAAAAMQGWNTQQNAALNTVSGWMTGLSALLGAGNVAGAAGWKPLAQRV